MKAGQVVETMAGRMIIMEVPNDGTCSAKVLSRGRTMWVGLAELKDWERMYSKYVERNND